ncbi:hypothetical protein SAMN04487907_101460 [Zunongwangia mangrovi]|uniref:Uncharacterized protein n=1 Tax=Zunongwangia mangrovi TaxID=1334022 RepID=A0A1I1DLF8_9FLAO|nr:hypothetical protein SAMN04487907_101460 [Zunongwangia mangrovi]
MNEPFRLGLKPESLPSSLTAGGEGLWLDQLIKDKQNHSKIMKIIDHTERLAFFIDTVLTRKSDPTLKTVGYGT